MSEKSGARYVIDRIFGGTASYDAVVGPGAPESSPQQERVWPAIPVHYCPPSPQNEHAVAEVDYLLGNLQRVLTPTPLPDDDLPLMSDYLLSLETRDDLTSHVLEQTNARDGISVVTRILLEDDSKYNFKSRATALETYWKNSVLLFEGHTPEEILADRPIAPSKALPEDKPAGWKLDLGAPQAAEARRQLEALSVGKRRRIKYWATVKPPKVIGWVPDSQEAWKKVSRADLEAGNLFFTPHFRPIWESYAMASLDGAFWTDPDNTPEEEEEYRVSQSGHHQLVTLSLEMRKARKAHAESLGHKGVW